MGKDTNSASGQMPSGGQEGLFRILIALLVLGMICGALQPGIEKCIHFYSRHQGQIRAVLVFAILSALLIGAAFLWNRHIKRTEEEFVTTKDEGSVYLGKDLDTGKDVHLKAQFRTMHAQVNGTTNAGKTASITEPWCIADIEQGRGCLIIDGKSDRKFLDKIYAHAVRAGRGKDFLIFSLPTPGLSSTFNPFCQGTPEQITERVFSAFTFENEYYRGIQFSALRTVIALLMKRGQAPMPAVIRELLRDKALLQGWCSGLSDPNLAKDVLALVKDSDETFAEKYSGLVTALGHFSQGATAALYNNRKPQIVLSNLIRERKICYFQLPTAQFPFLGQATGKLLLQSLQSAVSEIQVSGETPKSLFSVYLDDFNDYIYPGFESLLNKSRSANVGVVFSHQSLGDLEKVGPAFKQIVLTNTNLKIIMRSNDPESAEYFSKMIGTRSAEKTTERSKRAFFGQEKTGDQSVRDVEEYLYHPNVFKSELGQGEGVVVIPHDRGRVVKRVKFRMREDLPAHDIPLRDLPIIDIVSEATCPDAKIEATKNPLGHGLAHGPAKEPLEKQGPPQ